ncbi:flagellar motor switch protein FliM [Halotalea alkalilenta]|uniref:Flagellar motor switch protein FliM n=1 Tax=Halotalea alkalilenta TaxID=376489 RepID=A0A172YH11_9GAMM|nr:flagellar motor switch protein FliM [Halotalea alkalilenta]ANF58362.1 flagellar motor switch protein FliM [Halotalea alkalilenta]
MANDQLSQEEIDALLNAGDDDGDERPKEQFHNGKRILPFDPASAKRSIRISRLPGLELINERFARRFRNSLFDLIRRGSDITVMSQRLEKHVDFARNLPVPANLNVISLSPLHGQALVVFPPEFVLLVVDSLFGGDGRFALKTEGRDFTRTEQRIISRLLGIALQCYGEAWEEIYVVAPLHQRSETQAKFASIVNMPSELVVHTTFRLEVGAFGSDFHICMPYSMIEPIRELLSGPMQRGAPEQERVRIERLSREVENSSVDLVAEFTKLELSLSEVASLECGQILPIDLPQTLTANIDGVAVMECEFGRLNDRKALRVTRLIDHPAPTLDRLARSQAARDGDAKQDRTTTDKEA